MRRWLFKTEPEAFAWDDLVAAGVEEWDGVRNAAARGHMRAMAPGDRGILYHTGTVRACVGIVEVASAPHPDSTDPTGSWDCVDIRALAPLARPVTLAQVKAALPDMVLARQPRLSVQPVTEVEWARLLDLSTTAEP
ncbi:MAG: EVE domain-containing protein [Paracoccaceae bacterium]